MKSTREPDRLSPLIADLGAMRQRRGVSQAELARRAGCTRSLVHAVEHGLAMPSLPRLVALGDALGLQLGWKAQTDHGWDWVTRRLDAITLDEISDMVGTIVQSILPVEQVQFDVAPGYPYSLGESPPRQILMDGTRYVLQFRAGRLIIESSLPLDNERDALLKKVWDTVDAWLENYRAAYQARIFRMLFDTATRLSEERDPTPLLQQAVNRAREFLQSDLSYVTLMDRERNTVHMKVASGHRHPDFLRIVLPLGVGLGGRVARDRTPLAVPDYLNADTLDHDPQTDAIVRQEGIRAILGVPLIVRNNVLGVMFAAKREPARFTDLEVTLLQSLADFSALALDNAEAFRHLQHLADYRALAQTDAESGMRLYKLALDLERMAAASLTENPDLSHLLGVLRELLQREVILTDLAYRPMVPPSVVAPRNWIRERQGEMLAITSAQKRTFQASDRLLVLPIIVRGQVTAWLWISQDGDPIPPALRHSLETVARIIGLYLSAETHRSEVGQDVITQLVTNAYPGPARTLNRWPILQSDHGFYLLYLKTSNSLNRPIYLQQLLQHLIHERPDDLVGLYQDYLIGITADADEHRLADALARIAQETGWDRRSLIAILGDRTSDPAVTTQTIRQAIGALDILADVLKHPITPARRLKLVWDVSRGNVERLDILMREQLSPISDDPDLLNTLYTYFSLGQNQKQTAKALAVHLNTLRYRLDKARDKMGDVFHDPVKRLSLELALTIWDTISWNRLPPS